MESLKYSNVDIVFQEVPDEVSIAINITGCPHKCEGCHSNYLWEYFGNNLLDDLDALLNSYKGLISCVCFMGGDQNMDDLRTALRIVKGYELKTCVYSGEDDAILFKDILPMLDYLKVGRYIQKLGGLSSPTTNQRFYKVKNGFTDITERFYTKSL